MRKTLIFTLWAILFLVVAGVALIFNAIANGKIGYVPPIEELENPKDFIDFANKKAKVEALDEDYQILDVWFDRTKYGAEIHELAEKLVVELLQDLQSKEGIDGAVQKMAEAIAGGRDLLPEVSPELKKKSGRAR